MNDPINPNHYKTASGVECIDVASLFPYALGNAIKYAWRAGQKDDVRQDLKKCEWYINFAWENGEFFMFKPRTQNACRAKALFNKIKEGIGMPDLNYYLVGMLVNGEYHQALSYIDRKITELNNG